MSSAQEVAEKVTALGVPITLVNSETGEIRDFVFKYTSMRIRRLEKEFGSLRKAAQAVQTLTLGPRDPDWATLWKIVSDHKTPEEFLANFKDQSAATEFVESIIAFRPDGSRIDALARFMWPAMGDNFTTADSAISWITLDLFDETLEAAVEALNQALPSNALEKEKNASGGPEGNAQTPAENPMTGPSTGDSSTTSQPSDLAVAMSSSGTE